MAFKRTNPREVFRLLAKTSQDESEVWLFSLLLRFEVRKWHVALHSFAVLAPPLPHVCPARCRAGWPRPRSGQIDTGTKVKRPPRTGFLKYLQSQTVWIHTHPAVLSCLKHTGVGIQQKMTEEMLPGLVSDFPSLTLDGSRSLLRGGVLRLLSYMNESRFKSYSGQARCHMAQEIQWTEYSNQSEHRKRN